MEPPEPMASPHCEEKLMKKYRFKEDQDNGMTHAGDVNDVPYEQSESRELQMVRQKDVEIEDTNSLNENWKNELDIKGAFRDHKSQLINSLSEFEILFGRSPEMHKYYKASCRADLKLFKDDLLCSLSFKHKCNGPWEGRD